MLKTPRFLKGKKINRRIRGRYQVRRSHPSVITTPADATDYLTDRVTVTKLDDSLEAIVSRIHAWRLASAHIRRHTRHPRTANSVTRDARSPTCRHPMGKREAATNGLKNIYINHRAISPPCGGLGKTRRLYKVWKADCSALGVWRGTDWARLGWTNR